MGDRSRIGAAEKAGGECEEGEGGEEEEEHEEQRDEPSLCHVLLLLLLLLLLQDVREIGSWQRSPAPTPCPPRHLPSCQQVVSRVRMERCSGCLQLGGELASSPLRVHRSSNPHIFSSRLPCWLAWSWSI
eukprot:696354-Hanusia_phi.AAC.2